LPLHSLIKGKDTKERHMKIEEKVERLESHLREHPSDYQAVIAHLKARSDMYEHVAHQRTIERLKRVAEIKRQRKDRKEQKHGNQ